MGLRVTSSSPLRQPPARVRGGRRVQGGAWPVPDACSQVQAAPPSKPREQTCNTNHSSLTATVDDLSARQLSGPSSRGVSAAAARFAAAYAASGATALKPGAFGQAVSRFEAQPAAQHVGAVLVARQRQLLNLQRQGYGCSSNSSEMSSNKKQDCAAALPGARFRTQQLRATLHTLLCISDMFAVNF